MFRIFSYTQKGVVILGCFLSMIISFQYVVAQEDAVENVSSFSLSSTIHSVPEGGRWKDTSTWVEGRIPNENDIVEINSNVTTNVDRVIAGLHITEDGSLRGYRFQGGSITINGDMYMNGLVDRYTSLRLGGSLETSGIWESPGLHLFNEDERYIVGDIFGTNVILDNDIHILNDEIFIEKLISSDFIITTTNDDALLYLNELHGELHTNARIQFGNNTRADSRQRANVIANDVVVIGPHSIDDGISLEANSIHFLDTAIVNPYSSFSGVDYYIAGDFINDSDINRYVNIHLDGSIVNSGSWDNPLYLYGENTISLDGLDTVSVSLENDIRVDNINTYIYEIYTHNVSTVMLPNSQSHIFVNNIIGDIDINGILHVGFGNITTTQSNNIIAETVVFYKPHVAFLSSVTADTIVLQENARFAPKPRQDNSQTSIFGNLINYGTSYGNISLYHKGSLQNYGNIEGYHVLWDEDEGGSYGFRFSESDSEIATNTISSSINKRNYYTIDNQNFLIEPFVNGGSAFWQGKSGDNPWTQVYSINGGIPLPDFLKEESYFTVNTLSDIHRFDDLRVEITAHDNTYTDSVNLFLVYDSGKILLGQTDVIDGVGAFESLEIEEFPGNYRIEVSDNERIGYSNNFTILDPEINPNFFTLSHTNTFPVGTESFPVTIRAEDSDFSGIVNISFDNDSIEPVTTALIDGSIETIIYLPENLNAGEYTMFVTAEHREGASGFTLRKKSSGGSQTHYSSDWLDSIFGNSDSDDDIPTDKEVEIEDSLEEILEDTLEEETEPVPEPSLLLENNCLGIQSIQSTLFKNNPDVINNKKLQLFLIEYKYLSGFADGIFGNQTYSALRNFQVNNGLVADGIFGPGTSQFIENNCGDINEKSNDNVEISEEIVVEDHANQYSENVTQGIIIFSDIKDLILNPIISIYNWVESLFVQEDKINPVLIDTENNEVILIKETILEKDVIISFADGTNKTAVSEYTLDILRDVLINSNNTYAVITSTSRTPEVQAQAMINNILLKGIASQYKLYGKNGDLVLDEYPNKESMINKIYELGPESVSKHCADFKYKNVIDIAPTSIEKRTNFLNSSKEENRISKVLSPEEQEGENAYHLEIPQN